MSHLTAHSPATSVLKVRIWGDSGRGPVTSLPRGSLIATYLYYPTNFNSDYHSPVLAGVPDGWSFGSNDKLKAFSDRLLSSMAGATAANNDLGTEMNGVNGPDGEDGDGLHAPSIRMQKTFVPLVLAEDVTVRKSSPNAAWADTYVSAALSGVTELHGKWCSGRGCNSGKPGEMFQAGEEFWVYLDCTNNEGRQDCILSAQPSVAARRNCAESYRQICKPLGEFVHPPLRLSYDSRELISGVYIDPLTSKALRQAAGDVFGDRRPKFPDAFGQNTWTTLYTTSFSVSNDENKAMLKVLVDEALHAATQIPEQKEGEANRGTFTGFLTAIAEFDDALDAAGEYKDFYEARNRFANDANTKAVFEIFKGLAKEVNSGRLGLRYSNTKGTVVREPKGVITGYSGIDERVFKLFGGRIRAVGGSASADQTNALNGHGTRLV